MSCKFIEEIAALLPATGSAFEFGSGRSTHVLRRVAAQVASIEHSDQWLNRTEQSNGSVTKRAADYSAVIPLQRCWNRLRLIESFDLEAAPETLDRLKRARLILVDSPPNPAKREDALFLALRHAPIGAVIVLDDLAVRATARFAHRLARQNAKRFRFWVLNIDHTLGIFLKLRPGRIESRPSLVEFVGTWLRT
ncbi:MAG TPA: hypothetical protein DCO65_09350 [Spartobacteria bacterium]|nr:hypothetical protein [Spartobacteria bacterium]